MCVVGVCVRVWCSAVTELNVVHRQGGDAEDCLAHLKPQRLSVFRVDDRPAVTLERDTRAHTCTHAHWTKGQWEKAALVSIVFDRAAFLCFFLIFNVWRWCVSGVWKSLSVSLDGRSQKPLWLVVLLEVPNPKSFVAKYSCCCVLFDVLEIPLKRKPDWNQKTERVYDWL